MCIVGFFVFLLAADFGKLEKKQMADEFLRSKFGKIIRIETTIPTRPKALLYRDAMRFAA
tara:strand:+ start:93 stop:272 length:180 start_codon:yes stop_codon:yes gene_type:complete